MSASLSCSVLLRNVHKTNIVTVALRRQLSASATRWSTQSPVGFIGLGNMGGHMARNLLQKGYPVVIYDVVPESISALQKDGASVVSSPADVAAQTTQIVTMLPSSPHVLEVYSGSNGIFSKLQKGTLLIDSSTIDPMVSQQMQKEAAGKGAAFVDAPVSGGVLAAKGGTLTFMVGGPEKDFTSAKEILQHMGKNIVHCGAVGSGQAAKICNNTLLAISMIGTAETMNLGIKLGLDPKVLAGVLNTSSGRCWSSEVYNPVPGVVEGVPSSNNYQGGFGTALMTKDLGLAQAAATKTQAPLPMGSLAHQIYRMMCKKGYAGRDFSSAYKFISEEV